MFSVPFTVVAEPLAPRSTAPPPKVVLPVEVANILLALAAVAFVISPPFVKLHLQTELDFKNTA